MLATIQPLSQPVSALPTAMNEVSSAYCVAVARRSHTLIM
jgi:hypothetical protein